MRAVSLAEALARIAELEEEVRQLRADLFGEGSGAPLPDGVRLSPFRRRLWDCLWHRRERLWTRDALMVALYRDKDAPMVKTLDAHICHLRRILGGHGIAIETVWGDGYRLVGWPATLEARP